MGYKDDIEYLEKFLMHNKDEDYPMIDIVKILLKVVKGINNND